MKTQQFIIDSLYAELEVGSQMLLSDLLSAGIINQEERSKAWLILTKIKGMAVDEYYFTLACFFLLYLEQDF